MEILVVVLVVCMIITSVTAEPCLTYENFTADSRRSPSHIESVYENKICDAVLSSKWYRLVGDAGSDLTNDSSVLVSNGCGTTHQRWMNGTVPDVSEGTVDRQICMRSVFSICHTSFTIQVKNCCYFRVYYLKSATSCPQAYCVSPSLVPPEDCSQISWTTTTTSSSSTVATTTRITTTTTQSTTTVQKEKDEHVTIVEKVNSIVIVTVAVLLVVMVMTSIGFFIFKHSKFSKVDTENGSKYTVSAVQVRFQQDIQQHVQVHVEEHDYINVCQGVVVEKGVAPVYTGHT